VPATWRCLLEELAPVFRRRSTHALFIALACGMILAGRRTVVAMAAAAGMAAGFRRACWFFSHAAWDTDDLGVAVARLIVRYLLFRLWRGKGTASQVELAAQMLTTLTAAFPGRVIHGVGDAAFHSQALICGNSTWTTPHRLVSQASMRISQHMVAASLRTRLLYPDWPGR
jgi:hypothetical protein